MKPALFLHAGRYWLAGIAVIIVAWTLLAALIPSVVLPQPGVVVRAFFDEPARYLENCLQTAKEAMMGLVIAGAISMGIILMVARFPKMEQVLTPYLVVAKTSPAVAFVPIFIVAVGSGIWSKILVSAMISFFAVAIGGLDGIKGTPDRYRRLGLTYGARPWTAFQSIGYPYMLSGLMTGLKTAAPLSVVGAIVGEYVAGGASVGLGIFIAASAANNQVGQVYVSVTLACILGLALFSAMSAIHFFVRSAYQLDF